MIDYIDVHRDEFGVEPICRVLAEHGVPIAPSSYRAARTRAPSPRALSDAALAEVIEATFWDREKGRGVYGARKMWHQLRRDGVTGPGGTPVARCTVERLMRSLGLRGARRGRPVVTTRPDRSSSRAPDLVERDFHAETPNRLWVVDFTYVPTWTGTVFTAFVCDVFSRRIVGWRTSSAMPTELPLDALEMALWTREHAGHTDSGQLLGLVHHSDAGSQYTAIRYGSRLAEAGALASIGSVGDSYDNAMAESVIGLYKTECVRRDGPWRTVDDLELATLSWVHWFNHHRLHSKIGNVPPVEHEQTYYPSASHPRTAALGRTQPPLNPGRFNRPRLVMNPEEYGELADDLAAVIDTEPTAGGFGPMLDGPVAHEEAEGLDGYLRPSPEDIVPTMRDNGLEDPEV